MSYLATFRSFLSYAERLENAELLGKLSTLKLEGMEMIEENLQLRQSNLDMAERIRELERKLQFASSLTFVYGLYHAISEDGRVGEPYCPTCWEANQVAVHLHYREYVGYSCNHCSKQFEYFPRDPNATKEAIAAGNKPRATLEEMSANARR